MVPIPTFNFLSNNISPVLLERKLSSVFLLSLTPLGLLKLTSDFGFLASSSKSCFYFNLYLCFYSQVLYLESSKEFLLPADFSFSTLQFTLSVCCFFATFP